MILSNSYQRQNTETEMDEVLSFLKSEWSNPMVFLGNFLKEKGDYVNEKDNLVSSLNPGR